MLKSCFHQLNIRYPFFNWWNALPSIVFQWIWFLLDNGTPISGLAVSSSVVSIKRPIGVKIRNKSSEWCRAVFWRVYKSYNSPDKTVRPFDGYKLEILKQWKQIRLSLHTFNVMCFILKKISKLWIRFVLMTTQYGIKWVFVVQKSHYSINWNRSLKFAS